MSEDTAAAEPVAPLPQRVPPAAAAAEPPATPAPVAPGKVRVRVTMFDHPIDVWPDEIPVLRGQGLLADDQPAQPSEGTHP